MDLWHAGGADPNLEVYDLYEKSHFLWDDEEQTILIGLSEEGEEIARNKDTVTVSIPEGTKAISKVGTQLKDAPFSYYDGNPADSPILAGSSQEGYWSKVSKIKLPSTLLELNDHAFYNCELVTSIELPENLQKIGYLAMGAMSFEEITLPASITELGDSCFYDCQELTTVNFDDGFNLNYLPTYFLGFCGGIKEFTVPECVTEIGDMAFDGCESLEKVVLHDEITKIGSLAFSQCNALKTIVLPENLNEVSNDYFNGSFTSSKYVDSQFVDEVRFDAIICQSKEQYDKLMAGSDTIKLKDVEKAKLTYIVKVEFKEEDQVVATEYKLAGMDAKWTLENDVWAEATDYDLPTGTWDNGSGETLTVEGLTALLTKETLQGDVLTINKKAV